MYKEDLALNNLQWLICHKSQSNQIENIQQSEKKLLRNYTEYKCTMNAIP